MYLLWLVANLDVERCANGLYVAIRLPLYSLNVDAVGHDLSVSPVTAVQVYAHRPLGGAVGVGRMPKLRLAGIGQVVDVICSKLVVVVLTLSLKLS